MKNLLLYVILLILISLQSYSQEIINITGKETLDVIQQISIPGINDIIGFQKLNSSTSNYASIQQTGVSNTANINQQNDGTSTLPNQLYTVQSGISNELNFVQTGSGNLILGFQLGYLNPLTNALLASQLGSQNFNMLSTVIQNDATGVETGDGNKMSITQTNGINNFVMAVQQGSDNTLSSEQTGNNNYLLALQKGTNNTINDFKQGNISDQVLYDKIVQIGDNLTFKSDITSKSSVNGNTFTQTGTNLSLEMNSDLVNSPGGLQVNQIGKNMNVVINQSYFSFPLK